MPPTAKFTRDGITIFRRYDSPGAVFYTRMRFDGKIKTLSLAETAKDSFEIAIAARRARVTGKFDLFKATLQKRPSGPQTTVADLLPLYRKFPGNIKAHTKECNINALRSLVADAQGLQRGTLNYHAWSSIRLDQLTADFAEKWKDTIRARANAEPDEQRRDQILRSANSVLAAARSLFARSRRNDLPAYYKRADDIELPACIDRFRTTPGFGGVSKTEYHAPDDAIVARTLTALDALVPAPTEPQPVQDELNLYLACWLAIGFGLRASEISRALCGNFQLVTGDVFFRPLWRAKNNKVPEIGIQLDAWTRLSPHILNRPANEYVLKGSDTERTSDVFKRISVWMKSLGWQTTHHIHELRAWAGCQIVAGRSGSDQNWEAARRFLRHSHVSTTQNYYGHHFRAKIEKVPLPNLNQKAA